MVLNKIREAVASYFSEDLRRAFAVPVLAAVAFFALHVFIIGVQAAWMFCFMGKDPMVHTDAFRAYIWDSGIPYYSALIEQIAWVLSLLGIMASMFIGVCASVIVVYYIFKGIYKAYEIAC